MIYIYIPIAIADGRIEASPIETNTRITNDKAKKCVLSSRKWSKLKAKFLKKIYRNNSNS